ncbi:hypothetical protein K438DRAFT_1854178 [Mycena galopus ATCC 62051]|nr:hypothetical protein K438DRAFT_1854178 [Mycena galopus ATCC 62051]
MSRPLELLPHPLLDEIVDIALLLSPALRSPFLSSLGSCLHASTVRVLFHTVSLQDSARALALESSASAAYPVLCNPARYASTVKTLVITNPLLPEDGNALLNEMPIDADLIIRLLGICVNIEALVWESAFPPPDGLCEVLAMRNPRLLKVVFAPPPLTPPQRCSLAKWDAPSLPLLSGLPGLTSLHLCRLSQAGARAFAALLESLGDESLLESLDIDFVWLDDPLCEKIVVAGRKIQKLRLSTSGTKLSDKGIVAILEGCELEEFTLDEVEGRLSRTLWTKPTCFPATLKTLRVIIAETGPHHSWATDHLDSLHAVPLGSLSVLDVVRREAPPSIQCGVAVYDGIVDEAVALKLIPSAFMDQMKQQKSQMTSFRCDFWSFSIADVKLLLECSPKLERMQLCLDAPFSKLIGLTSTFASLSSLHTLSVSITPAHAPGKPPAPILPSPSSHSSSTSLPTPTESPVLKSKSVLPQLLDFDQMQTQTCHLETPGDPSMPLVREIKRFVRKCPQLEVIEWYGKNGRGSWVITRPATSSKISVNVAVEYIAPAVIEDTWKAIVREKAIEDAVKRGWGGFAEIERTGHVWTGEAAEAFAAKRLAAEKEKEEAAAATSSPVERAGKSREAEKRARMPSMSISSSSGSDVLLPLTPTTSPVHHTPLTPPLSDYSVSEADAASLRNCTSSNRKRSPSMPSAQNAGASKQRTRSATTASNSKDTAGDRSTGSTAASGTAGSRGAKSNRGRGGGANSNTRGPRKPAGNNTESSSSSSGRPRGGRGPRTANSESTRPRRPAAAA